MKLKEFQEKYHIRRIDFNQIKPTENDVEYGSDKLICPYCKAENEYEKYKVSQDKNYVSDFDKLLNETKQIENK